MRDPFGVGEESFEFICFPKKVVNLSARIYTRISVLIPKLPWARIPDQNQKPALVDLLKGSGNRTGTTRAVPFCIAYRLVYSGRSWSAEAHHIRTEKGPRCDWMGTLVELYYVEFGGVVTALQTVEQVSWGMATRYTWHSKTARILTLYSLYNPCITLL